uniref:Uncharacterized protein n=1 Tax=Anopheles dirus TaxID=7168 RepID=A0A182NCB3_9DIPT
TDQKKKVLVAHLHHRLKKILELEAAESFFWSDSTITLKWIESSPNTWKTFVASRVSEIQHHSHPRQWRHVSGSTNPADLVSRWSFSLMTRYLSPDGPSYASWKYTMGTINSLA